MSFIKNCSYYITKSVNTGRVYSSPSETCGDVTYYDPHGNELLTEPVPLTEVRLTIPNGSGTRIINDNVPSSKKFYIPNSTLMKSKIDNLENGGVNGENLPCPVKIVFRECPKRGSRISFSDKHDNTIVDLPLFEGFDVQDIAHETKHNGILFLSNIYYDYIDREWISRNTSNIALTLPRPYEEYDRRMEPACIIC